MFLSTEFSSISQQYSPINPTKRLIPIWYWFFFRFLFLLTLSFLSFLAGLSSFLSSFLFFTAAPRRLVDYMCHENSANSRRIHNGDKYHQKLDGNNSHVSGFRFKIINPTFIYTFCVGVCLLLRNFSFFFINWFPHCLLWYALVLAVFPICTGVYPRLLSPAHMSA